MSGQDDDGTCAVRAERKIDENTVTADEAALIYFLRKDTRPALILMGDADWPARRKRDASAILPPRRRPWETTVSRCMSSTDHDSIGASWER